MKKWTAFIWAILITGILTIILPNMEVFAATPANVKQVGASAYSVSFTADNMPGADNLYDYKIYYSADQGVTWSSSVAIYSSLHQCFSLHGLKPATVYFMYVMDSEGKTSETIEVVTAPELGDEYDDADVALTAMTSTTSTIRWGEVNGADGYVVYVNNKEILSTTDTFVKLKKSQMPAVKKRDIDGLDYNVNVFPYKSCKGFRATTSFSLGEGFAVFAPDKPTVNWNWNQYRKVLEVEAKSNYSYNDMEIVCYDVKTGKKLSSSRTKKSEISKVDASTIYKFKIRISNSYKGIVGQSSWSDYVYALSQPVVSVKKLNSGTLKLTWNKISKCTGYDVYIKKNGASQYTKVASIGAKKNTCIIKKLAGKDISANSSYSVYVVAKKKVKGVVYESQKNYKYSV